MLKLNELYGEILTESPYSGKHLVVIDIQPEYEGGFEYWLSEFVEFMNENRNEFSRVTFLYNGAETLGMIEEGTYKDWWFQNQLDEGIIYDSNFYDKGYAFFRYCLDEIGEDETTNLVRHMIKYDVNDSRELGDEFWNTFVEEYGDDDVRELMEFSDDAINIPDLIDEIKDYNNVVICGGHINECLKEVEIALNAINKPYSTLTQFTY